MTDGPTSDAKAAEGDDTPEAPPPGAGVPDAPSSWGYPAFARDFPRTPELDALVASFARGDYRAVREGASRVVAAATDDDVKRAAELLRSRIEPDPLAKVLFAFAAALLVTLTAWWVLRHGAGAPPHEEGRLMPSRPATSAVPPKP